MIKYFKICNKLLIFKPVTSKHTCPLISFSRNISICSLLKVSNKLDKDNIKKCDENEKHTWVGPPHPVSNLRLKVFPNSKNLTEEEKYFYVKSRETQEWNQQYWELHNKDFLESRKHFIKELSKKKNLGSEYTLTMEEMSDFYRQFLDKNYKKHVSYNWQWYRRNFELIYLSAKAELSKVKRWLKRGIS